MKKILFYPLVFILSCKSSYIPPAPPQLDKELILNSAPNALDKVGVVFAIGKNGIRDYVPNGNLSLKTTSSNAGITQGFRKKTVSWGVLTNFLGTNDIANKNSVGISDTTTIQATFKINQETITRIDDDITSAFLLKRESILRNIKILGYQNRDLYIINETIQSKDFEITLDKITDFHSDINFAYKDILKSNPLFENNLHSNSGITYKRDEPVTVFYKLNRLFIDSIDDRGSGDKQYVLRLGEIVSEQLNIKNSKL